MRPTAGAVSRLEWVGGQFGSSDLLFGSPLGPRANARPGSIARGAPGPGKQPSNLKPNEVFATHSEYAIPAEAAAAALKSLRLVLDEADARLRLPIEVRFVAADQDPISPAHGRDTCYIGVATLVNATEVFERVEPIMKDLGGRPHWGKHFNLTRDEATAMYPGTYQDFVALRRQYDPQGIFLNSLLRRLFE